MYELQTNLHTKSLPDDVYVALKPLAVTEKSDVNLTNKNRCVDV